MNRMSPLVPFVLCLAFACGQNEKKAGPIEPPPTPANVCAIVDAEKIRTALTQSGQKEVLLGIYPIKRSVDSKGQDFELAIVFQDTAGNRIMLPGEESQAEHERMISNYISFLHSNNIAEEKIARGFYFQFDSLKAFSITKFNVCTEPQTAYMWSCNDEEMEYPTDSAGKCPPDCCPKPLTRIASRTAGVCPPDCAVANLLYKPYMEKIIADLYKPAKN